MLGVHPTEQAAIEAAKTLIDIHLALKDLITPGFEEDQVEVILTKKQVAFLQVMVEQQLFGDVQ